MPAKQRGKSATRGSTSPVPNRDGATTGGGPANMADLALVEDQHHDDANVEGTQTAAATTVNDSASAVTTAAVTSADVPASGLLPLGNAPPAGTPTQQLLRGRVVPRFVDEDGEVTENERLPPAQVAAAKQPPLQGAPPVPPRTPPVPSRTPPASASAATTTADQRRRQRADEAPASTSTSTQVVHRAPVVTAPILGAAPQQQQQQPVGAIGSLLGVPSVNTSAAHAPAAHAPASVVTSAAAPIANAPAVVDMTAQVGTGGPAAYGVPQSYVPQTMNPVVTEMLARASADQRIAEQRTALAATMVAEVAGIPGHAGWAVGAGRAGTVLAARIARMAYTAESVGEQWRPLRHHMLGVVAMHGGSNVIRQASAEGARITEELYYPEHLRTAAYIGEQSGRGIGEIQSPLWFLAAGVVIVHRIMGAAASNMRASDPLASFSFWLAEMQNVAFGATIAGAQIMAAMAPVAVVRDVPDITYAASGAAASAAASSAATATVTPQPATVVRDNRDEQQRRDNGNNQGSRGGQRWHDRGPKPQPKKNNGRGSGPSAGGAAAGA